MENKTFVRLTMLVVMAMMPLTNSFAQDWKSILSGISSSLGDKISDKVSNKTPAFSVSGKWTYTKPDCKFESDDLLLKAGGEVAAVKVEQRMTEMMTKLGIDDKAVFTFNEDSTYTIAMGKRILRGTYSLNKETKEVKMTSRFKTTFTAKVAYNVLNPGKMSFMFKADKLMSLAQNITGTLAKKSTNKTVNSFNSLLNKYDGLTLGFELLKEGYEDKADKLNELLTNSKDK